MRLQVNAPRVIHETIDHEVVIIDLTTGTYYSLEGTAEEIWTLLAQGVPTEHLSAILLARYEDDPAVVSSAIERFVDQLLAEVLVVPDSRSPAVVAATGAGPKRPFVPPQLERFTEMQQLIALDPIHEVDEAQGWPHT